MSKPHTSRDYENELRQLRQHLLIMAGRVEAMIANAVEAFVNRDTELARRTIAADHQVNQDEVDADELCLRILARRQPMASDLRFVTLTLKMVTDLERIADLAVSICVRALDLTNGNGDQAQYKLEERIPELARLTQSMISQAIDAFVQSDEQKARAVIERDDQVDDIYHATFRAILQRMLEDPQFVERGIRISSVAKYLERMADHSTNLAEQVIFMVKGKDVRHQGKLVDD